MAVEAKAMKEIPFPACADDITAEWMQEALAAGGLLESPQVAALEVEQLSDVSNAMGNLFRCRLIARNGSTVHPHSVVVKLPSSNAIAHRLAKWLSLYRREYVFYSNVAPSARIRVPSLHFGNLDSRGDRLVLVLEDLAGMEAVSQSVGVGVEKARRAIREIAEVQGQFWEKADDPALADCGEFLTVKHRRIMQTLFLLTLPLAFERFGELFTTDTRRLAEALGSKIDAHFASVAKGPRTIVHGDFRADNVLFGGERQNGMAVIDWQGCGIGCGMYDVAFFNATSLTTEDRRRFEHDALSEYHDIVCRTGAKNFTRDDCWNSYRQNMLGTLMPMILGAGGIDMNDKRIVNQTRELLGRTLTAIEDLDSWEFLPVRDGPLSSSGAFSFISRCGYRAYTFMLRMRRRKGQ